MQHQSQKVECQNKKLGSKYCEGDFVIEPEDFAFYEKIKVPPPTFCPTCRLQRRLIWRNERTLYKNTCLLCKKDLVSIINKNNPYKVYCPKCWWGDTWDGVDFGLNYKFSEKFFAQLEYLIQCVPWVSLQTIHSTLQNSEYVNMCGFSKNCYLTSHADHNEDCMYSSGVKFSRNCIDVFMINKSENCYESINCVDCNKIFYSNDCRQSYDIYFSKNLIGCNNCFGCVNLVNKSYCIFNQQYSKKEYLEKINSFDLSKYSKINKYQNEFMEFCYKFPQKYYHGFFNKNFSGDYLYQSKNTKNSFEVFSVEDSKFCSFLSTPKSQDCFDYTEWGDNAFHVYESIICGVNISNILFCWVVQSNSFNATYSMHCINCHDIFGCIGLKNKSYCILNKQYSKEEYEKLVPKIIQHMNDMPYIDSKGRVYKYGEFFPIELSLYCYNEAVYDFFPMNKKEAELLGYSWKDKEEKDYNITIVAENLPDDIKGVDESILKEVIGCLHNQSCDHQCTKAFKIIKEELIFYKNYNLPLPRLCPNCRHSERLSQINPQKLWHRKCMKESCGNEFETTYAPDRPEIVYCEKCYQNEVY